MTKLPRPSGKDLVAALGKLGFQVIRIRGSHHYLRHADGRATLVLVHAGETIGPGLMTRILHDCELTREDIESLL